jgi:hypothetical protein
MSPRATAAAEDHLVAYSTANAAFKHRTAKNDRIGQAGLPAAQLLPYPTAFNAPRAFS